MRAKWHICEQCRNTQNQAIIKSGNQKLQYTLLAHGLTYVHTDIHSNQPAIKLFFRTRLHFRTTVGLVPQWTYITIPRIPSIITEICLFIRRHSAADAEHQWRQLTLQHLLSSLSLSTLDTGHLLTTTACNNNKSTHLMRAQLTN